MISMQNIGNVFPWNSLEKNLSGGIPLNSLQKSLVSAEVLDRINGENSAELQINVSTLHRPLQRFLYGDTKGYSNLTDKMLFRKPPLQNLGFLDNILSLGFE